MNVSLPLTWSRKLGPLFFYGSFLIALSIWWILAFAPFSSSSSSKDLSLLSTLTNSSNHSFPVVYPYLSTMDRHELHEALSGNVEMIKKLLVEWDLDAQIILHHGVKNVKQLPRDRFLRGQLLGRSLTSQEGTEPNPHQYKFLPQTFQSAGFLTALTPLSSITALPKGFRQYTSLYPKNITDQIQHDIAPYQLESIVISQNPSPLLAIVSNRFTHPSVIHILHNLGITVFAERQTDTFEDILASLMEMGFAAHTPQKAELLSIFMEAALLAIDNRLLASQHLSDKTLFPTPAAYLTYYNDFSIPTTDSLTGQLLCRLNKMIPFILTKGDFGGTIIPIEHHTLKEIDPHCLLISTPNPQEIVTALTHSKPLQQLEAVRKRKIYFLDESVQLTTDQYIVLAYYDIANRLIQELET